MTKIWISAITRSGRICLHLIAGIIRTKASPIGRFTLKYNPNLNPKLTRKGVSLLKELLRINKSNMIQMDF